MGRFAWRDERTDLGRTFVPRALHVLALLGLMYVLLGVWFLSAPGTHTASAVMRIIRSLNAIKIQIPGDYRQNDEFRKHVLHTFNDMEKLSPYLRQILEAAKNAPVEIVITPITDDPSTWYSNGDRKNSHTKRYGRQNLGSSIIFIDPDRIDPSHRSYSKGTLPHELVHAIDFAYGRLNPDYEIREKRAVFVQNIWRDLHGNKLRKSYHGRFPTLEYQSAKEKGRIQYYMNNIFSGDGFLGY